MYQFETGILEQSEYFFHTPTALAKSLLFYVEICGHFYTDHNYEVKRDNFGNYLLLYVTNGTMQIEISEEKTSVASGNAALINCHMPHRYYTPKRCEFYYVHFDGSNSGALYEHIRQTQGTVFPVNEHGTLPGYLNQLLAVSRGRKPVSEITLSQTIYSLLSDIISAPQAETLSGSKAEIIEKALEFIRVNLDEPIYLDDIASHVGLSTYHFARLFKRATGTSPHEYILLSRIDKAKYLLRTTQSSIQEIAFQVGYTSESSFINSFSGRVGMPPGKFRRMFPSIC